MQQNSKKQPEKPFRLPFRRRPKAKQPETVHPAAPFAPSPAPKRGGVGVGAFRQKRWFVQRKRLPPPQPSPVLTGEGAPFAGSLAYSGCLFRVWNGIKAIRRHRFRCAGRTRCRLHRCRPAVGCAPRTVWRYCGLGQDPTMQRHPLLMLALPPKLSAKNKKDCPKGSLKSRTAFVRNGKKQPETASEPFQAAFVCLLLLLLDRHHDFVALFAAAGECDDFCNGFGDFFVAGFLAFFLESGDFSDQFFIDAGAGAVA